MYRLCWNSYTRVCCSFQELIHIFVIFDWFREIVTFWRIDTNSSHFKRYLNDPVYEEKARKALDTIWNKRHQGTGLVGTVINTANGDWVRRESGVGAGIDSYYEYLLKVWGQENKKVNFSKF